MRDLRKKINIIAVIIILLITTACSKGNEANSTTEPTTDEYGNSNEVIKRATGDMKGTLFADTNLTKVSNSDSEKKVEEKLQNADLAKDNKNFENICGEVDEGISVWSLVSDGSEESLDKKGIIIRKDGVNYNFPNVYHGNNPIAEVNEESGLVLFAGGFMEGTGVHSEAFYVFKPNASGDYEIVNAISPYKVQNKIIDMIKYSIDGNKITFKNGNKTICETVNMEDGMGALSEVWVGEQISYEFDEDCNVKVNITPGKKFSDGIVLMYDAMPTFVANMNYDDKNANLTNLIVVTE